MRRAQSDQGPVRDVTFLVKERHANGSMPLAMRRLTPRAPWPQNDALAIALTARHARGARSTREVACTPAMTNELAIWIAFSRIVEVSDCLAFGRRWPRTLCALAEAREEERFSCVVHASYLSRPL